MGSCVLVISLARPFIISFRLSFEAILVKKILQPNVFLKYFVSVYFSLVPLFALRSAGLGGFVYIWGSSVV